MLAGSFLSGAVLSMQAFLLLLQKLMVPTWLLHLWISVHFGQEKKGTEKGLVSRSEKQRLGQKLPLFAYIVLTRIVSHGPCYLQETSGNCFYNSTTLRINL